MNEADRILLAQTVNAANLSWQADAYLEGSPRLAQTSAKHTAKTFGEDTQEFKDALSEAQLFLDRDFDSIDISEIPDEWDWQNVKGYDFTPKVYDQGSCGSCYLLASNAMLESRIRIWFG